MKHKSRFVGIDDVAFDKKQTHTQIIGAITKGCEGLDGVISSKVTIDGDDATQVIIDMIRNSKFRDQIQGIFLKGLAVGGFNLVDIKMLSTELNVPVVVIMRNPPKNIRETMLNLGFDNKIPILDAAGLVHVYSHGEESEIYYQTFETSERMIKHIMSITCDEAIIPEPLRLAKMIAKGLKNYCISC